MTKHVTRGIALLLGTLFLASGWLKGVDPFGTSLKVDEYVGLFQLSFLADAAMALSVLLCALEMLVGLLLLFGLYKRLVACIAFIAMLGFTIITAYLAFDPFSAIQECGCFGTAVKLTNIETFGKNIILLLLSGIYAFLLFNKCKPDKTDSFIKMFVLPLYLLLFTLAIPLYSMLYLPPFDFLSFNRGDDLLSNAKLSIFNANFEEVKDSLLLHGDKPIFAVVMQEGLSGSEFDKLDPIFEMHRKGDIDCFIFTNKEEKVYNNVAQYYIDPVTLKSMIRAKSGMLLIDKGHIIGKWNLKHSQFADLNTANLDVLIAKETYLLLWYGLAIAVALLIALFLYIKSERRKYI